jgi:hypothetical protein
MCIRATQLAAAGIAVSQRTVSAAGVMLIVETIGLLKMKNNIGYVLGMVLVFSALILAMFFVMNGVIK